MRVLSGVPARLGVFFPLALCNTADAARSPTCVCLLLSITPRLSPHHRVYYRQFNGCGKEYRPPQVRPRSAHEEFSRAFTGGELTADELLRRYCTQVYAQTGSYEETARRLQLDRRTVKSKIDRHLLERFSTQPLRASYGEH